jgi:chemotaxis response regulator CheB
MTRVRILLVGLPALLRDILSESLAREKDVDMLATAANREGLTTLVQRTRPDVLILGSLGSEAAASVVSGIHQVTPSILVIAISPKSDRATVFKPGSAPLEIADVSSDALLQTIRDHRAVNDSTRLPLA